MARTQHIRLQMQNAGAGLAPRASFSEEMFVRQPLFQAETGLNGGMICRTQEDGAAYPDMVYRAEKRKRRFFHPHCSRELEDALSGGIMDNGGAGRETETQADVRPVMGMEPLDAPSMEEGNGEAEMLDAPWPDTLDGQAAPATHSIRRAERHRRRAAQQEEPQELPEDNWPKGPVIPIGHRHTNRLWTGIALVCALLLALLMVAVFRWRQAYFPFREKVAIVSQDTIAQGVLIDGVHVGGMTRSQAVQALVTDASQAGEILHMTVQVDGQTWVITPEELPFVRNTASVLETAYAIGRQGSVETIASDTTPFEYRYQHLYHTVETHVQLHTEVTYDPATVRSLVGIIEANINRDAVDAQVATFDFSKRAFTFTEDRAGAKLDGDKLYDQISAAINRKDLQAVITAFSEPITPRVTKAELMNSFALVSTYTTETTSSATRNTNINLAANAVSGTVVMPGETFSFNQTTGQRTAEKGYLPAAAISCGTTVDEIGGCVCQVSSTLFNAAAMADLTILSRSPHTWPSTYVEKGRDATVNWPNLDFTFRNDKTTPVFIVAYYEERKITVEIYGATLGAGESIDLTTKLISAIEPPAEPIYVQNPSLAAGTMEEKKKARTGYIVETYKVYKRNGREVRRELLCTSNYQMIQQVLEYN